MPKPKTADTTPAKGTAEVSKKPYEVGRGKPPKATRFQKGKSGNPKGRPKKKQEDFDPGKILQAIDNDETAVDGKRKLRKKAELLFRNLFTEAIMESVGRREPHAGGRQSISIADASCGSGFTH